MAQRRYHVQLSVFEGGMLVASFALASVLIFVFGMYIGKEVQAQKIAHQAESLRVPVVLSKNQILSRPSAPAALPPARLTPPAGLETRSKRPQTSVAVTQQLAESRRSERRAERLPKQPAKQLAKKLPKKLPKVQAKLPTPLPSPPSPPSRPGRKAARHVEQYHEKPGEQPAQKLAKKPDARPTQWKVQVQATTQEKAAQQSAKRLRRLGYTPMLSKIHRQGQVLYRVRVGPFSTESDAKAAIARFRRDQAFSQAYLVSQ